MSIRRGSLFMLVWRGWFAGMTVVFLPFFALAVLVEPSLPKMMIFALPVIAALQGVVVGGIVVLGLKIWRPKEPA